LNYTRDAILILDFRWAIATETSRKCKIAARHIRF